jgi:hypothetical protein
METGPKLTDEQVDKYVAQMVKNGVPVRFLYNGQALSIQSGELAPKGSNVMYHPVYWNFTRETAKEIAEDLGVRAVFDKIDEEDDTMKESETIRNYKKSKIKFKTGDEVVLRPDVLKRHSQSVPAHAGYTTAQFSWRKTLDRLAGMKGTIERVFPNSKHVNVEFEDGTVIGIDSTELERIGDVVQDGKSNQNLEEQIQDMVGEVIASLMSETFYVSNKGHLSFGEERKVRQFIRKEVVKILSEDGNKILLQDDDDAEIDADKTQEYTNEEGVKFWAEYDPEVKAWVCIQQVDGYPETEAHDDWFGRKEDAENICKKLANGII